MKRWSRADPNAAMSATLEVMKRAACPRVSIFPESSTELPRRVMLQAMSAWSPLLLSASQPSIDVHVARALSAMRASPAHAWTVAELAKVGGLSRAAFARRFTRAMGKAPLRWLTEYRLQRAEKELRETDRTLTNIAEEIGYGSEFAFSKAFKRHYGVAPTVFRRRLRPAHEIFTTQSSWFRAAA